jgi:regulator of cell morphogenesis and NO signaling
MTATTLLSEIAVAHPAASRVFQRYRLDYCCGGRRPLADACRDKGLDADAVLAEITQAQADDPSPTRWETAPLPALIDFIVSRYHNGLRVELPELVAMAAKVEGVHAEKTTCPHGLHQHLRAIEASVYDHLAKEEQILFPMIKAGAGARAAAPVHVMEVEHDDHRENLAKTRAMTTDLVPPDEACTTWRALYLRLAQLEADLMQHIHLENNILFPRALGR